MATIKKKMWTTTRTTTKKRRRRKVKKCSPRKRRPRVKRTQEGEPSKKLSGTPDDDDFAMSRRDLATAGSNVRTGVDAVIIE